MWAGGGFRAISICSRLISVMGKVWHEGQNIFTQFGGDNYVTDVTHIALMCLFASTI